MLVCLSPSKTIRTDSSIKDEPTLPRFLNKSEQLVLELRQLRPNQLSKLMAISPKLAQLNFERFQQWCLPFTPENAIQTLFAFKGEAYNGLGAETLKLNEVNFTQNHLIILSGLYGILRPLDLIQPYRLEMGIKASFANSKNLYDFWKDSVTQGIQQALDNQNDKIIINLASNEYFKSIDLKRLNANVVTPEFKECKNGTCKIVSVYAKKARGLMTRFIIQNKLKQPEQLKLFDADGYYYNEHLSSENNLVFTR